MICWHFLLHLHLWLQNYPPPPPPRKINFPEEQFWQSSGQPCCDHGWVTLPRWWGSTSLLSHSGSERCGHWCSWGCRWQTLTHQKSHWCGTVLDRRMTRSVMFVIWNTRKQNWCSTRHEATSVRCMFRNLVLQITSTTQTWRQILPLLLYKRTVMR